MKGQYKHKLSKILITISAGLLLVVGVIGLCFGLFELNKPVETKDASFSDVNKNYSSNQAQVINYTLPTASVTVSFSTVMANATNLNTDYKSQSKTITISTADELYYFSYYANQASYRANLLKQNYKLSNNIDYSKRTNYSNYFIPIAWDTTASVTSFSGTFDGQGYEISNLSILPMLELTGTLSSYENMEYLAMFSKNTGTIKDFGLNQCSIRVNGTINKLSTTGGVSNVVGHNAGTMSNVFYKDLRDTKADEVGIAAYGGYTVAGLVVNNTGSMTDCYMAVSNVLNYTVTDYDLITEAVAYSTGTISGVYFYDSSIATCSSTEISFRNNLYETVFYTSAKPLVGTYVNSLTNLRSTFAAKTGWFVFDDYGTLANELKESVNTPIYRGVTVTDGTNAAGETVHNVAITSVKDFLYMYELMNISSKFADETMVYNIQSDIDLNGVPESAYYYKRVIGSTIQGVANTGTVKPTLADNNKSTYPTIYNFNPLSKNRLVVTTGVDSYGLFPYISGSISNLNILPGAIDSNFSLDSSIDLTSANVKAIGALTGYAEGATITNVNTALYVSLNNSNLGEYYLGSTVGILGGESTLDSVTSAGKFDLNASSSTIPSPSTFTGGIGVGGTVGYVSETYGSLHNVLSATKINAKLGASVTYMIGGVAGAGYLMNTSELENIGDITIGQSGVTTTYSKLYVSGVIGRLLGVNAQITSLTNQGSINVYTSSSATRTDVSGVLNADIITSASGNVIASSFKSKAGRYLFWASSITNQANVNVYNNGSTLNYTNVINVNAENNFDSTLSSVYNLNYSNLYSSGTKTKTYLGAQSVTMNVANTYAPVVNVINGANTTASTTLTKAYNLRDINFVLSGSLTATTLKYSGAVLGKNINLTDIRNEGNLAFTVNQTMTITKFYIMGVFEEVSAGYTANTIVNGGQIAMNVASAITTTMTKLYVSGICYANRNNYYVGNYTKNYNPAYDPYNPLSSDFDMSLTGSLANVINNGDITIDQAGAKTNSVNNISGNVKVAGIVNVNENVISSAFNLGNITYNSYMDENGWYWCGGIATIQSTRYAQVKDCANNGTIKAINMSTNACKMVCAGLVATDLINESDDSYYGSNTTTENSQSMIIFSINYGSVVLFNGAAIQKEDATTFNVPGAIAAGVFGSGICNMINTVNYANVYGSDTISGLIGTINFNYFQGEVTSSRNVYIANSINYGNIYTIGHRYTETGVPKAMTYEYASTVDVAANKDTFIDKAVILTVHESSHYGSCIAIANYNTTANAQYINIRYLLNINSVASMIGLESKVPTSVTGATTTMFSAKKNDRYLNSGVVYSPLTTTSTAEATGLFSSEFAFRKAIEGRVTLNTTTNPTDAFLGDYFEFVGFSKINDNLLNTIGWTSIAYNSAAQDFANNLTALGKLIKLYDAKNDSSYNTLLTNALNTSTWVDKCSETVLTQLVSDVLSSQDLTSLKSIINYLFYESTNNNQITATMRQSVVDTIVTYIDSQKSDSELISILDTLMISETLAKVIAASDTEYANIKAVLKTDISGLSKDSKIELINTYVGLLTNNNYYADMFTTYSTYYTEEKKAVITKLLSGLSTEILADIYASIDTGTSYSTSMSMSYALERMNNTEKANFYSQIITYNATTYMNYETQIVALLKQLNFDTNADQYFTDTTAGSLSTSIKSSDANYLEVWNNIKNDASVQTYLASQMGYVQDANTNNVHKGIYAIATEYRNSYQSNDAPAGTTYTINNDGTVTNGGTKLHRATERGSLIKTRFIYTPDEYVSDARTYTTGVQTYYYGPYVSAPTVTVTTTGNSITTPTTAVMWNNSKGQGAPLIGYKLNANDNTGTTATVRYVPVYISIDKSYMENLTGGTVGVNFFEFLWNDVPSSNASQCAQWVSQEIISSQPDNNQYVLKKDSSHTFNYRVYATNGSYSTKTYNTKNTLYFNWSNVGQRTTTNDLEDNIAYNGVSNNNSNWNRSDVLFSYIASTYITGIYYQQDMWGQNGAFLTAKDNQGDGVITTRYIDYTVNDLVNLDGKRTKGLSTGYEDSDEITIIKNVMNNYLLNTSAGQKVVMKALAKVMQNGLISTNISYAFFNALNGNQPFMNAFIANMPTTSDSYTLPYDGTYTVSTYLKNYFDVNIFPSMVTTDKIIIYSADSRENLQKVFNYFYDKGGYYLYLDNIQTIYNIITQYNTDDYQIIRDYLDSVANKRTETEYTEAIINTTLSTATDANINSMLSDYNTLNDIDNVDITSSGNYTYSNAKIELSTMTYDSKGYWTAVGSKDGTNSYTLTYSPSTAIRMTFIAGGSGTISVGSQSVTVNGNNAYVIEIESGSNTFTFTSGVKLYEVKEEVRTRTNYSSTTDNVIVSCNMDKATDKNWTYDGVTYSGVTTGNTKTIVFKKLSNASTVTIRGRMDGTTAQNRTGTVTINNETKTFAGPTETDLVFDISSITVGTNITITCKANSGKLVFYGFFFDDILYTFNSGSNTAFSVPSTTYYNILLTGDRYITVPTDYAAVMNSTTVSDISAYSIGDNHYNFTSEISIYSKTQLSAYSYSYDTQSTTTDYATTYSNSIKNNSANKLFGGITKYESNEIELLAFNKQYANNLMNFDISSLSGSMTQDVVVGGYTIKYLSNSRFEANETVTFGNTTYNNYFVMSQYSSQDAGSIHFTMAKSGKLYIVARAQWDSSDIITISSGSTAVAWGTLPTSVTCQEYKLSAGSYYFKSSVATFIYDICVVYDDDVEAINTNYQNIATKAATLKSSINSLDSTKAQYWTYYNYINRKALFDANTNTVTTFYDDTVLLLALTKETDINLYNKLSNEQIVQLLKLAGYKLDNVLGTANATTSTGLISYIDAATAKTVIQTLGAGSFDLLVDTINGATLNSTTVPDASNLEYELIGAYVGVDFLEELSTNTISTSIMDDIIEKLGSQYDFIQDDNSIATTQFITLMNAVGISVATDGYGIYALASSHGIQNGTFIPDNIDLRTLDTNYSKINGTNIISLTDANSPSWRDTTGTSTSSSYVVTNTDSVNYHVREEMKQLKKSISTTVFELDLAYNTSTNIYASESQVNSITGEITYVVSTAYSIVMRRKTSIDISNISIAESASYNTNLSNLTSASWILNEDGSYTLPNALIVTAEDTTVSKNYSIRLVAKTISYTYAFESIIYKNSETSTTTTISTNVMDIPYYGATISLKVTSPSFEDGFDLKNYFFISTSNATTATASYEEGVDWAFNTAASNNGIMKDGSATIVIDVNQSMPEGIKYFTLKFYATTAAAMQRVELTKAANASALITSFGFDGTDLTSTITGSSKTATSSIPFGRAYTMEELTDYTSNSFYLYDFKYSSNAVPTITATKAVSNGIMTYTVTYLITSESGGFKTTYTHKLVEKNPYTNGDAYANIYRDGTNINSSIYAEDFDYNSTTMLGTNSSLTYINNNTFVAVIFNRGNDYQYRIKYNLGNFYIIDQDTNFDASAATKANGSAIIKSYAGLTLQVTEGQNPGVYKFEYVYSNTATWTGTEEYTRTYTFPALYVIKDFAVDALINKLTFLDESIVLGNTATVMAATTPLIPTNTDGSKYNVSTYDGTEALYKNAFLNGTNIIIDTSTIVYENGTGDKSVTDYYALGTVSDSDLTYYAPTFGINTYGQIYKYVTLKMLEEYGSDVTDKSILSYHQNERTFIYVPFEYSSGSTSIVKSFLVELEYGTNNWVAVYETSFTGTESAVHTYSSGVTTLSATSDTSNAGFTYDGVTYSVSSLAGTTDEENVSLFMDYIGNPSEGHFWYVSYVVFSEYYLENGITDANNDGVDDVGAIKYYHISIIDATNTIYFEVDVYAPVDFDTTDIYLTIAENIYDAKDEAKLSARQISAYAVVDHEYNKVTLTAETYQANKYYSLNRDGIYVLETGSFSSNTVYYEQGDVLISKDYDKVTITSSDWKADTYYTLNTTTGEYILSTAFASGTQYYKRSATYGLVKYTLKYNLAVLPKGYFYFYIDLPSGYTASCITSMANQLSKSSNKTTEAGSFVPYTSIITQTIQLSVMISEGSGVDAKAWALSTSDLYTRQIEYIGTSWDDKSN